MKKIIALISVYALLAVAPAAHASSATDELFARYKSEGASNFDAERGKKNWTKEGKGDEGEMVSCSTCHTSDLTKEGQHKKTKKVIKPMAPSVNAERLTDVKKIEKWFKRNCNDAWNRECTAQEKGDFLKFLSSK